MKRSTLIVNKLKISSGIVSIFRRVRQAFSFSLLLYLYVLELFLETKLVQKFDSQKKLASFLSKLTIRLDVSGKKIRRRQLIRIGLKNMKNRQTRTIVTVGGMAISFGVVVLLLALGYGLQDLVIDRVASLQEMKQIEVVPQAGSETVINDRILAEVDQLEFVEQSLPVIAVVGKLDVNDSEIDIAAYGVTTDFLQKSALALSRGRLFDNNQISLPSSELPNFDDTPTPEKGSEIESIEFGIEPGKWIAVRENPSLDSSVIGYTKHSNLYHTGLTVWGDPYLDGVKNVIEARDSRNKPIAKWVQADFSLWEQKDGEYVEQQTGAGTQKTKEGFITASSVNIRLSDEETQIKKVGDRWVEIFAEEATASAKTSTVSLPDKERQLVINQAALSILNMDESAAIGKEINVQLVATEGLPPESGLDQVRSDSLTYEIVGITSERSSPIIYTPFIDLRQLGIVNYSQMKVVVVDQKVVPVVRQQIEAKGLTTTSVLDTVNRINSLFSSIRVVLGIIGSFALFIAALGMFNTLTVSLLERNREVGAMKAMGMSSDEIFEMFMVESLLMGLFGGMLGLLFGYLAAKTIEIVVSMLSIFEGVGYLNLVAVPISLIILVIILSLVVGMLTGLYPARRARMVSALDALRYE